MVLKDDRIVEEKSKMRVFDGIAQLAAIVEKTEGFRSCCQKSLIDLESLYDALNQKAFKGDLDLSRM